MKTSNTGKLAHMLLLLSVIAIFQGCLFDEIDPDEVNCEEQSFVIDFPAKGDSLTLNTEYSITWKTCLNDVEEVDIILLLDGDSVKALASGITNKGTFKWKINGQLQTDNKYAIKISNSADKKEFAESEEFGIGRKNIEPCAGDEDIFIMEPNSSSKITVGSSMEFSWESCVETSDFVNIAFYVGDTLLGELRTGEINDGSFFWRIPDGFPSGNNYRVKISDSEDAKIFAFSETFAVVSNYSGTIDITKSPEGDTVVMGTTSEIKWKSEGNIGDEVSIYLLKKDSVVSVLSSYTPDDGVQKVSFDGRTQSGSHFKIKVQSRADASIYAESGEFFIIPFVFTSPQMEDTLISGKSYTIKWKGAGSSNISLKLYKGDAKVLDITSSLYGKTEYKWKVPSTIYNGSDYKIQLQDSYSKIKIYSDSFSVTNPYADSYEPDNSFKQAGEISVDGSVQNHYAANGDEDWIYFIPKKNWIYKINMFSDKYKDLYLYDHNKKRLKGFYRKTDVTTWRASPDTNAFYLQVLRNSSSDTGMYSISVKAYDPNGLAEFETPNSSTEWNSGGGYIIEWLPDETLFGTQVNLSLEYEGKNVKTLKSKIVNDGSSSVTMPEGLASDISYKIKISNASNSQIYGYSPEFKITGVELDKYEPNNSKYNYIEIEPDESSWLNTLYYGDEDWFKFSADSGKLYMVKSKGDTLPIIEGYYDNGKLALPSSVLSTTDSSVSYSWFCISDGEYFFKISGEQTGSFSLSFREYGSSQYLFDVSSPKSGSSFSGEDTLSIKWDNGLEIGGKVDILLLNGDDLETTIQANTANDGSYNWVIPGAIPAGENYSIRVVHSISTSIFGDSGEFSIEE